MRVFLDTNILMYAAGASHPHKAPSTRLLERVAEGSVDAVTDAEVLQELLYRSWHLHMLEQGVALVEHALQIIPAVLPVAKQDLVLASTLLTQHRTLEPRDAIHAAVMLNHGITRLYSYDRHFDAISNLERLQP